MSMEERMYTSEESGAFIEQFTIEPSGSGPLNGLEFGVKDIVDVAGYKTSFGNPHWLESHPVAATNAVCVDQLLIAGGRCVGKTHTAEMAFSLDGENAFYGTPLNPRAPDRVPGGSSSGSASAVACGLADFAVGSDTGGSVRVPAADCGLYGIRPSYGIISMAGVCPFAPSFDTIGVLARTPNVLSKSASVLLACDIPSQVEVESLYILRDAFDLCDKVVRESLRTSLDELKDMFPGNVRETTVMEISNDPRSLWEWYDDVYRTIQWAEIMSSLGSWIDDVKPEFGPRTDVNFRLARALDRKKIGPASYGKEQYFQYLNSFLGPCDLLCLPTVPALAPIKGSLGHDRTKGHYYPRALTLTTIAGLGKLPQVTMPLAEAGTVPVGLSLIARYGNDGFLLRAVETIASSIA